MKRAGIIFIVIGCIVVISAVSWHSVEEIHYLKTFYPETFTVEEAYYASKVELVKVAIISLPLVVVIMAGLFLLKGFDKAK